MKRLLILLMFAGWTVLPASVTLDKAVKDGLALDVDVNNGEIDMDSARKRLRLARSRFLPDLDAGGSWRYQSQRMHLVIDPVIQGGRMVFPGLERTIGTLHNWDLYLGVTQPLYTGGILSRRRDQAEVRVREESQRLRAARVSRSLEIRAAYYTHAMLLERRDSALRLAGRLEIHLRRLEALAAEELARRSDVLETRSRLVETRLTLEEMEQAVDEAANRFHELCGHAVDQVTASGHIRRFSRREAGDFFRSRHPQLEAMDNQKQWLQLEEAVAAGRYRPSLAGHASFHLGRPGIDMFSAEWMGYAAVGITFSMPVFHWHRGREERGLVRAEARKLDNRRRNLLRLVSYQLDRIYRRLEMRARLVEELEELVALTREDGRIKGDLVREKQIANLEYLAVLTDCERAESRLAAAHCDLTLTQLAVHRAIGYMEEEE